MFIATFKIKFSKYTCSPCQDIIYFCNQYTYIEYVSIGTLISTAYVNRLKKKTKKTKTYGIFIKYCISKISV